MDSIIKLNSRGGIDNCLRKLKNVSGKDSKTYVLKHDYISVKSGYVEGTKRFISPPGGPTIVEGEFLKEAGAVVKSIIYSIGYGHIVIFE